MAALEHVNWAKSEAQDIVFTRLSWALSVALAVNLLFVGAALVNGAHTGLHAGTVMVNCALRAHGGAHVALGDCEAGRALGEPLVLALLAVAALLFLSVASPQRKRFLASKLRLLKELRAGEVLVEGLHVELVVVVLGRSRRCPL